MSILSGRKWSHPRLLSNVKDVLRMYCLKRKPFGSLSNGLQ